MPGTSSAKTRFALLPGHDEFVGSSASYSSTNVTVSATLAREVR
jgi:hypothetical protein